MASAAMAASSRALLRPHRLLLLPDPRSRRRLSAIAAVSANAAAAASTAVRRSVVDVLRERGLVEATTSEALGSSPSAGGQQQQLKAYCGFDPTAESLHLGNLLGLVALSWFRRCGHTAVALVGGATGRVGDPSGKSAERPELDLAAVAANSDAIKSLIAQILGRAPEPSHYSKSGKNAILDENEHALANSCQGLSENVGGKMGSFVILDNYDWWKDITLLDFLKEVGKFARVGTMVAKESVKKRLNSEDGMSYTEFTYQLLQGYDFLYMFKNMGVNVQIGGSDQWGNITAGTDLIRKILQVEGAHGLTFPLLLKSDGTKFGKTEDGAIWLSSKMLSPYKFYQYFFSVPDVDVIRFMKILTFLSLDEILELEKSMKRPGYVPNTVQRILAEEVTRFVHGQEGLEEALKATQALRPGAQTQLDSQTIEGIADDVPSCSLPYDQVLKSPLVDLAASTGLLASKSAVRRLIKQGGLYLNNIKIDSEDKLVEEGDIVDGKVLLLSAGKKNKMVVRIS
ncbi:tyrosine--tRNA ligase, chloroplastic/mitochondrial [Brachypodium distachyon]|uniref:Tyrosine--tRNA ligase n=1 Tax=Brachypodium distachyon TaxID=15368 RepID=I1I4L8_BRADI|nr:tyrosine--tRNA ligase, chloroplastic/mitochondrial [Brachypodium distachyon]KQJ97056.1 hypothetical protein BRADI_3g28520v3 [Brachypodium distachyon]|eukprot:XP_003574045.1 tyrosine--tRNA ligase, chloroplastic/mitochondrial [Brachypodium distachyon]